METGLQRRMASFLGGYLQYYSARNIKNVLLNDRSAIAKDLMAQAKQQINSESFRKQYETIRNSAKPVEYHYELKKKSGKRRLLKWKNQSLNQKRW